MDVILLTNSSQNRRSSKTNGTINILLCEHQQTDTGTEFPYQLDHSIKMPPSRGLLFPVKDSEWSQCFSESLISQLVKSNMISYAFLESVGETDKLVTGAQKNTVKYAMYCLCSLNPVFMNLVFDIKKLSHLWKLLNKQNH